MSNSCIICGTGCLGPYCDRCGDRYDLPRKALELMSLGYYARPRLLLEWHAAPRPLKFWLERGLNGYEVLRLYPYLPDQATWDRHVAIRGCSGPVWRVWRNAPYLTPADVTYALWGRPEQPWGPTPKLWTGRTDSGAQK